MTTLEFLNNNSSYPIDQTKWDDEILENEYDIDKNIIRNEYNDFGINGMYTNNVNEYKLDKLDKFNNIFRYSIDDLEIDIIDKISLKIKLNSNINKLLLFSFYIRIYIKTKKDIITMISTNLLDINLLSYLNNTEIEEDDYLNTITIPILQFNTLEYGYLYRKLPKKNIVIIFENATLGYTENYKNIIDDVTIIFNGKKYYNFDELIITNDKYYKAIDVYWFFTPYNSNGILIKGIETKYQFIVFKLIKKFASENDINEFINNQPEVYEVSFQHKNNLQWIYDLTYMKKVILFGVNIYILPMYSEFTNLKNMMYYLKTSNNGMDMYMDKYILKVKTNIVDEEYDMYISFFGEFID